MWPFILLGLLVACLAGWLLTWQHQRNRIRQLERSNEEIQVEETLVFDFLHGLGEAFTETIRAADLHRLIVEGAARILDAHGGALYMMERAGAKLAPAFISKGCPPFVEVPPDILQKAATTPAGAGKLSAAASHRCRRGHDRPGLANRRAGLSDRSRERLRTGDPARHRSRRHVRHGHAASLRKTKHGRAGARQRARERAFYAERFRRFQIDRRAIGLRPLQRHHLFGSEREEAARSRSPDRARHSAHPAPGEAPVIEGFEISGINIPARQVSGDYFDYIKVDEERLGVAIADVSGKGVPASLIMAICRSVLRSQAAGNPSPADVLQKVNRQLYPDIKEDMFISMAYVILDHARNRSRSPARAMTPRCFTSARRESVTPIKPPGMVVGIDSGSVFDRITGDFALPLERDDCLILYTDGVTEALDRKRRRIRPRTHDRVRSRQRAQRRPGHNHAFDRRAAELRWSAAAK